MDGRLGNGRGNGYGYDGNGDGDGGYSNGDGSGDGNHGESVVCSSYEDVAGSVLRAVIGSLLQSVRR